jgi:hypothetical protein
VVGRMVGVVAVDPPGGFLVLTGEQSVETLIRKYLAPCRGHAVTLLCLTTRGETCWLHGWGVHDSGGSNNRLVSTAVAAAA